MEHSVAVAVAVVAVAVVAVAAADVDSSKVSVLCSGWAEEMLVSAGVVVASLLAPAAMCC
jgi:hypothetical protein